MGLCLRLGRKKRGFGAGMITGPGGKARLDESDAACAPREVDEEAGIVIDPDSLAWRRCDIRASGHPRGTESRGRTSGGRPQAG